MPRQTERQRLIKKFCRTYKKGSLSKDEFLRRNKSALDSYLYDNLYAARAKKRREGEVLPDSRARPSGLKYDKTGSLADWHRKKREELGYEAYRSLMLAASEGKVNIRELMRDE